MVRIISLSWQRRFYLRGGDFLRGGCRQQHHQSVVAVSDANPKISGRRIDHPFFHRGKKPAVCRSIVAICEKGGREQQSPRLTQSCLKLSCIMLWRGDKLPTRDAWPGSGAKKFWR
jgi:hypothetical protein